MTTWIAISTLGAVGALTVVFAWHAGMGWVNPLSVYFSVWSITLSWFAFDWLDLAPLRRQTLLVVVDTSLLFAAGAVGAWVVLTATTRALPRRRTLEPRRLLRWHKIASAALLAYFALDIAAVLPTLEALASTDAISAGAGNDVRRALVEASLTKAQTEYSGGAAIGSLLEYILFLGSLSLFTAPLVLRLSRQRLLGLAPLLFLVAHSIVTLQRFSFVYGLLLFAFGALYSRSIVSLHDGTETQGPRPISRSLSVGAAIVVLLGAALVIPIELRNPDSNIGDHLESIAYYSASGLAGLNLTIESDHIPPRANGAYTVWGLASIAHRFGLIAEPPPNRLRFQNIRENGRFSSNVYTYLVYPLYDFGRVGLYGFPFLFGLTASAVHFLVMRRKSVPLIPAGAILMASITMGFFGLSLVRDFRFVFVAVVGGFLFSHLFSFGRPDDARETLYVRPNPTPASQCDR